MDFQQIERKWQKRWQDELVFQPEVEPTKKKFFCTFPYPYVNGLPHIGHLFTIMRVEALARYKRMQGFNVLFPQGWHCTGSPIIAAAKRVQEGEAKQLQILRDLDVQEDELSKFVDPTFWISYFSPKYKEDLQRMGLSIDWRREFITTHLNPHYDAFIQWQFTLLKEKGYVIKGKFPVVWCPKEHAPVSDHSRIEGEGETPQEFVLFKHKLGNDLVVTATLRPETCMGITNIYIAPDVEYMKAKVNSEVWILSKECAEKLHDQERNVQILSFLKGNTLVGRVVQLFNGKKVPILPADFCDPSVGTGIVHSCPTDSPDDWIVLKSLQEHPEECMRQGIEPSLVKNIQLIPVLETPGYGSMPAVKLIEEYNITSKKDTAKIEQAKKELYKKSFYESTMNALYKNKTFFSESYEGMPVLVAKEKIKKDLLDRKHAELFYELTGKVVCRCLTQSVVKIVDDQWFITYNDPSWKERVHVCLKKLRLYPEKARQQFSYVVDWLREWACTREEGLGTRLPWDEKWLIESLSDSTMYMAFYTIAHRIKKIPPEQLTRQFFDYVFLGKGDKPVCGVDPDMLRSEFLYWYPVDFRNSGKDLIQNHLVFFMFNHVALFSEEHWPKGIGVNGWVLVDGKKMSKSLGNVIPVRRLVETYSADASRFTILNGGESMDDPNWDSELAKTMHAKLEQLHAFCLEYYDNGRTNEIAVDVWFVSEIQRIIRETTAAMEETLFRTAMQHAYFDMQRLVKRYLKRVNNGQNKNAMNLFIETQLLFLAPFTPHICEEIWHALGKKGFIATAAWPHANEDKIDCIKTFAESTIDTVLADVRIVMQLAKIEKPQEITLFIAESWKYVLYSLVKEKLTKTRNTGDILTALMQTNLKQHGQEITKLLPKIIEKMPPIILSQEEEFTHLFEAKAYFAKEFSCPVHILKAESSSEAKAKQARPWKPAIHVK